MKAAHVKRVSERAARVRAFLLPGTVDGAAVPDPQDRLRQLLLRTGGREGLPPDTSLRQAVAEVTRFLETDVPELVQAVFDAQREAREARSALALRAGTTYKAVVYSAAPVKVEYVTEVPEEDSGGGGN
jgi:hypothetical protein